VQQQQPAQAPQQVQVQQQEPAPAAAAAQAAPQQVLAVKPALPTHETIKQLQEQVQQQAMPQMKAQLPPLQKQSLQQRLVASLPPSVQKEAEVAQPAGSSPMLVDGSAADTASLQQQAGQKASQQLLKGMGSDTPQQLSLRQQMEQKMIAKFNRAAAPANDDEAFGSYSQYPAMQQPPQMMPNQQQLAGAFGVSTLQQARQQANPQITRMMAMGA